jgi:hypothetical protein
MNDKNGIEVESGRIMRRVLLWESRQGSSASTFLFDLRILIVTLLRVPTNLILHYVIELQAWKL